MQKDSYRIVRSVKPSLKYLESWLAASVLSTILASALSTMRVISGLKDVGMELSLADGLSMMLYDVLHFGSVYGVFIAIALALGFAGFGMSARLAGRRARPLSISKAVQRVAMRIGYAVAGFCAICLMLVLMQRSFFGVPFVAGARDMTGVLLQSLCGGIGGVVYGLMTTGSKRPRPGAADGPQSGEDIKLPWI